MKSEEFIQTVNATIYLCDKTNLKEILPHIDEIRQIHFKLQNKLEDLLIDPFTFDLSDTKININNRALEIKTFCKEINIQCNFQKLGNFTEFSKQFHLTRQFVFYNYNGVNITDLIVFTKKKKIFKTIKKEEIEIGELKFDEDVNAQSFMMGPENDLPGTPLAFDK